MEAVLAYLPETYYSVAENLEFLFRIVLSGICGAVIGLERTKRQKEAGTRTHCIIACTAATFMILSKYAFFDSIPGNARGADASRIASQVVSGISFLGAGVIFKHGLSVRGLTTAAGIWATSAVGMAVGAGMYLVGAFETIVLVVIQVTLHRHPLGNDVKAIQDIMVCMNNSEEKYQLLHEFLEEHAAQIAESDMERKGDMLKIKMVVRVDIPITYEEALGFMNSNDGIYQIAV